MIVGKTAQTISNKKLCLNSCESNNTSRKIESSLTLIEAELNLMLSVKNIEIISKIAKFDKFLKGCAFRKKKEVTLSALKKNNQ